MESLAIENTNPYQRITGDAWGQVADGVQLALTAPLRAEGTLLIERAHSGITGLVVRFILLPPAGESVPAKLELRDEAGGVRWIREFGLLKAESMQTFKLRTYVEEAGPFRMEFQLEARGASLAHVQVGTKFCGVPVPRFCGPTVRALMSEGPDARSWRLVVDIAHVWFGTICRYEGVMYAQ